MKRKINKSENVGLDTPAFVPITLRIFFYTFVFIIVAYLVNGCASGGSDAQAMIGDIEQEIDSMISNIQNDLDGSGNIAYDTAVDDNVDECICDDVKYFYDSKDGYRIITTHYKFIYSGNGYYKKVKTGVDTSGN